MGVTGKIIEPGKVLSCFLIASKTCFVGALSLSLLIKNVRIQFKRFETEIKVMSTWIWLRRKRGKNVGSTTENKIERTSGRAPGTLRMEGEVVVVVVAVVVVMGKV